MHKNETHFGDKMTVTGQWFDCEFVDCKLTLEGPVTLDGCVFIGSTTLMGHRASTLTVRNCVWDTREITIDTE